MTAYEWFAAAGMPLIFVVLALVGLKLHNWDLKRHNRLHPGE